MLLLWSKSSTNYGTILTILLNEATMLLLKVSDFVNCLDILKSSLVIIMLPICTKECLVYTSNKREGEPGFSFPEGCPVGAARGERKPRLSRPLVGGISFH